MARWGPVRPAAALPAAAFVLVNVLFLPRSFYNIGLVNCVLAERGGLASFVYAHPLHLPLLELLSRALGAAGVGGPRLPWFQAESLAFSAATLVLCQRLLAAALESEGLAALGACALGFSGSFWYFATQTTPYPPALFFIALCLYLLAARPKPESAWAGAAAGLATGFTLAGAALAPAAAVFLWRGRPRAERGKYLARFLAGYGAAFAASWLPLLALHGGEVAADWARPGFLPRLWSVPGGPVWAEHLPWRQARTLALDFGRDAWPFCLLAPFLLALGRRRPLSPSSRRLVELCGAALAAFLVFFLVCDALNRFKYVLVFLVALLALAGVSAAPRLKPVFAAAAVLAAVGQFWSEAYPAARVPDPISREGDFLNNYLGPEGLLLCGGPPDWRLLYFFYPRINMLRIEAGPGDGNPFGLPGLAPGPELERRIGANLASGRRVVLAADRLFQLSEVLPEEEILRQEEAMVVFLTRRFRLGQPLVSPMGQRYYPLSPQRRL